MSLAIEFPLSNEGFKQPSRNTALLYLRTTSAHASAARWSRC